MPVANSGDDAEEGQNGAIDITSSDLELVFDEVDQTVGMRFVGLDIEPGAVITDAWIQFTVDEVSGGPVSLIITGDAAADSAMISPVDLDLSSRTRTAALVNWSPPDWPNVGAAGVDQPWRRTGRHPRANR